MESITVNEEETVKVGHPEARVDAEKMGDTVALTVAGGATVPPPLAVAHSEGDPVLAGDAENKRLAVEQPDTEYDRDPLEELVSQWVEEKLPEKEPLTVPHAVEDTDGVPHWEADADVEEKCDPVAQDVCVSSDVDAVRDAEMD